MVVANDDGITIWYGGRPWSTIRWDQLESVSFDIDDLVSGPRPCEAFWMISGGDQRLRIYVRQSAADELNRRLTALPDFDHEALRRAFDAESEGNSCVGASEPPNPAPS